MACSLFRKSLFIEHLSIELVGAVTARHCGTMHFPRAINDRPYNLNLKQLDKSEFTSCLVGENGGSFLRKISV